jgi:hypothetical protein
MTIKPDTSLYHNLPDKLRALALILDHPNIEDRQILLRGSWVHGGTDTSAVIRSLADESDLRSYRIKPKPREIYLASFTGHLGAPYDSREEAERENPEATRIIRFVEAVDE